VFSWTPATSLGASNALS
jgi:hypothetical protein